MIVRATSSEANLYRQAVTLFRGDQPDESFLETPSALCLIAIEEGAVAGWCWGYALPRPDGQAMMYLHQLDVAEEYRRRGLGRQLIEDFKRAGRVEGANRLFLITEEGNHPARMLYETCGGTLSAGSPTVTYWFDLQEP